jgi:hypothetical protein
VLAKFEFSSLSETQHWVHRLVEYARLANIVLKIRVPLPSTDEYKLGFLSFLQI